MGAALVRIQRARKSIGRVLQMRARREEAMMMPTNIKDGLDDGPQRR